MREARIILPFAENGGKDITFAHETLARELASTFGGFTAFNVQGGWVNGEGKLYLDAGRAYDVAMADTEENAAKLRGIARGIGKLTHQEAVYLRYANGEVDILTI
jgi:hypothetical protein